MPLDTDTGNPAPLGLACFGITTVVLSVYNAELLPAAGAIVVIPLAFIVGGFVQMFAGIMEYREGNTFGTVAFNAFGGFWVWLALLEFLGAVGVFDLSADGVAAGIGMALIVWGIFTAYLWVGTFRLNWGLWVVFLVLMVTFFLLGFGDLLGMPGLYIAGGYLGIVTGLAALYVSFAEVTNWCFGRTVLPLGGVPFGGGGDDQSAEPAD